MSFFIRFRPSLQKEAHALRVRVLQALSLGQDGAEATEGGAMGGLAELLEVVRAQGQEAAQLVLQAEGACWYMCVLYVGCVFFCTWVGFGFD